MTRFALLAYLIATAACAVDAEGDDAVCTGKCDGGNVDQTCDDPRYNDGVCQTSLSCAVPDIDCFMTFDDDAKAADWFASFETALATEQGRAPRAIVPTTDPRYAQAREMLDRGWDAFRAHRPVGLLADHRPAVVVVEDPAINAFVIPDRASDRSAFSVTIQTGLLAAGGSDDALLGVSMHELQHAVGLHLIGDVRERMRTFYIAPSSGEPIGREQTDDPQAREAGELWRSAASEIGPLPQETLGGLSLTGDLDRIFLAAINAGDANDHAACAHSITLTNHLRDEIIGSVDALDGTLAPVPQLETRVTEALTALRTECLANFPYSFVDVVASLAGTSPASIEAALPQHDRALVTNVHVIDAVANLVADRRATMRAAVASFEATTDRPFSALRYFSFEEDADDVTVPVLRGADLDPTGNSEFLLGALDSATRARCEATIDANDVPAYGADVSDEHHATCWRVHHLHQLAKRSGGGNARTAVTPPPARASRLPLPRRLADQIVH